MRSEMLHGVRFVGRHVSSGERGNVRRQAEVTNMQCPNCRLENPPEATYCDCGYTFATGKIRPSLSEPMREVYPSKASPTHWVCQACGSAIPFAFDHCLRCNAPQARSSPRAASTVPSDLRTAKQVRPLATFGFRVLWGFGLVVVAGLLNLVMSPAAAAIVTLVLFGVLQAVIAARNASRKGK